jgi:glutamate-1-semialdehyde aminotransferase
VDDDTACIILEPVVFEEPQRNFLHQLRDICTERGIILIFDEMWTGFRMALGGAQEYFGIKPDLACYSKAIANGMPLSVLTGRRDIMQLCEQDVFFYTTFGGEALSLAAAKATMLEMHNRNVQEHIAHIGRDLKQGVNDIAEELDMPYVRCMGFDSRTIVTFNAQAGDPLLMKSYVQQEMIRRGILWSGFHNVSYSHDDADVEFTLNAYRGVLMQLRDAVMRGTLAERLLGEPLKPVFRRTSNFHTRAKNVS